MRLEYLTDSKRIKDDLTSYKLECVDVSAQHFKGTSYSVIIFNTPGENEKSAKILSDVNVTVKTKYQAIKTLRNDSSEYFCNRLYAAIGEFERKLRKLLYIASSINGGRKASNAIGELENESLGKIFQTIFLDPQFISSMCKALKRWKKNQFTKEEFLTFVKDLKTQAQETEEIIIWDQLLDSNIAPTLRRRYSDITKYRNDVMHSHNINWNTYRDAQQLFKIVNSEIDVALNVAFTDKFSKYVKPNFNSVLEFTLAVQEAREIWEQTVGAFAAAIREIDERNNRVQEELSSRLRKNDEKLRRFSDTVSDISKAITSSGIIQYPPTCTLKQEDNSNNG